MSEQSNFGSLIVRAISLEWHLGIVKSDNYKLQVVCCLYLTQSSSSWYKPQRAAIAIYSAAKRMEHCNVPFLLQFVLIYSDFIKSIVFSNRKKGNLCEV